MQLYLKLVTHEGKVACMKDIFVNNNTPNHAG